MEGDSLHLEIDSQEDVVILGQRRMELEMKFFNTEYKLRYSATFSTSIEERSLVFLLSLPIIFYYHSLLLCIIFRKVPCTLESTEQKD